MDIRNVGTKGGIEPGNDRSKRAEANRDVVIPFPARDEARISSASRESAAAITNLAERARSGSSDREAIVASAKAKLVAGELDGESVVAAVAKRLLDAKFLSA